MPSELPKTIGRYEVTGRVSATTEGGPEVVYARHAGVTYLIHWLAAPQAMPRADLAKYERLSRDAAGLPRLVEVVEDLTHVALVFEPVEGVTLARLMNHLRVSEERFPDAAIWYVAHQLAQTLARCHAARGADGKPASMFHGRLAAENVLIGWDGRVFVMGMCPLVTGVELPGERPSRPSSAWYAPEVHQGASLTPRTDSYGVSLLLRAMLTGEDRPSPGSVSTSLSALRSDFPAELGRALDRGLLVTPTTRATCAELQRWISTMAREEVGQQALRDTVAPFESLGALWSNRLTSQLPPSDDLMRTQIAEPAAPKASADHTVKVGRVADEVAAALVTAPDSFPTVPRVGPPRPRTDSTSPTLPTANGTSKLRAQPDIDAPEVDDDSATIVHDELAASDVAFTAAKEEASDFEGTLIFDNDDGKAAPPGRLVTPRGTLQSATPPLAGASTVADEGDDESITDAPRKPLPLAGARPSLPPAPPKPPADISAGLLGTGGPRAQKTLTSHTPPVTAPRAVTTPPASEIRVEMAASVPTPAVETTATPNTVPIAAPSAEKTPATSRRALLPWLVLLGVVWGVAAAIFVVKWRARQAAEVSASSVTDLVSSAVPSAAVVPALAASVRAEAPLATATFATATATAEAAAPAPSSSAAPSASPSEVPPTSAAITDVTTRKPLSFEAYLTVKSSIDAPVYVQGVLVGRTNQKTLARCRWRNVRLGVDPGPFWISKMQVEYLPCLGAHEMTLEPDPALVAAEKQRKH